MRRDKGVHAFLNGISPKVNIIVKLEIKLTYYNDAVQNVGQRRSWDSL